MIPKATVATLKCLDKSDCMAITRVLNRHHFDDVLAGAAIGIGVAILIDQMHRNKR